MDGKRHFVLGHGAGTGAWCWYKVVAWLKSIGHRVTVLDLGGASMKLEGPNTILTMRDFMLPLMELMASLPQGEKVILVGHSCGGFCISLAMESFPERIEVAVYVAAFMPRPRTTPALPLQEVLELAKMLPTPARMFPMEDLANESLLTEERFGSVERVFVMCGEDKAIEVEFQRRMMDRSPPKAVKLIGEANHMAMLSKPHEFCQCFEEIAKNYS